MSLGMKNSKMSGKQMLALATNITGQDYKRGQYIKALQDLEIFTKGGI